MSKPISTRYRTTNWSEYSEALRRLGSPLAWLDLKMSWMAPKRGQPGRPETFSDAAVRFYLSITVLFGLALQRTIGMIGRLARTGWSGLDWTGWSGRFQTTLRCPNSIRPSPSRFLFGDQKSPQPPPRQHNHLGGSQPCYPLAPAPNALLRHSARGRAFVLSHGPGLTRVISASTKAKDRLPGARRTSVSGASRAEFYQATRLA
jgi:hypothetical protein